MSLYLLKNPPPFFLGAGSPKAQGRLTALQLPREASKFIFSIALSHSFCLHLISFFFLPPILYFPCLLHVSLALTLSHAVHTTPSQSVQWTRAQTVDWDITCSLERWSGWRRKKGRWRRLTNVQLHLNQSSEPESRSALGYFLNIKAKERRERERVCDSWLLSRQTAITDGPGSACFYF